MDTLPLETIVHILHFLPGNDVSRFRRLNYSFAKWIDDNRRRPGHDSLPHPNISVSCGADRDEPNGLFTITTAKSSFMFRVDSIDLVSLVAECPEASKFETPFVTYAISKQQNANKQLFVNWLFSIADLETLEMKGWQSSSIIKDVFEALKNTRCRCSNLSIQSHFLVFDDPYSPNYTDDLIEFSENQRKFQVFPNFHITCKQGSKFLKIANDVEKINSYGNIFNAVVCTFNFWRLFVPIRGITSRWLEGNLDAVKFKVRFDSRFAEDLHTYEHFMAHIAADSFMSLDHKLLKPSEDKLETLASVINVDNIPDEIVCQSNKDGSILTFKFAKVDNFVLLTAEIA